MIQAVNNLHSLDLYHWDIKIENFLLDNKNNLKIIDFNSCKK